MLTEYKGTKILLLMKRKGKLDNLANDAKALIQTRNETDRIAGSGKLIIIWRKLDGFKKLR